MDEFEKTTLMRTKQNLLRNLSRINDAVDASEFPLQDHAVLDDIKNSVKSLVKINGLLGPAPVVS